MFKLIFPILSNILCIVLCAFFLQIPVLCIGSDRAWIDGTCSLIDRANRIIPVIDDNSMLAPAQPPQIGDQKKFYAVDFSRSGRAYFTNATCRAVGEFCYIFVENSQWGKNVTNTGVARLRRAFDESTPANTSKGIFELETENLGLPPDEIDLDPKIYILILDIPDTHESGNFVAGYFEPINQKRGIVRDPNNGMQIQSNEVEMIYIDSNPLNVEDILTREILAHEFQHLIHWRYDPDEDIWINEGCSEYSALSLCGYQSGRQSAHVEAYEKEPQTSLVSWNNGMMGSLANYGASYLWMMYLHEHYGGVSTISSIITEQTHGINSINNVLTSKGYSQRFNDVFSDWKVANYLDSDNYESGKYGYSNLDLIPIYSYKHDAFPISSRSHFMQSWSANYIEFIGGNGTSNLNIDFNTKQSYDFDIRVVSIRDEKPVAVESMIVESGKGQISIPLFGNNTDKVVLIPNWIPKTNADINETVTYTYSADLGDKIGFKVKLLPNAINSRYVDLIARISENKANDIPRISLTRLGKTIVNNQKMTPMSNMKKDINYIYQIYFPMGWNGAEIKWQISYLGRSIISGDLESVSIQNSQLEK